MDKSFAASRWLAGGRDAAAANPMRNLIDQMSADLRHKLLSVLKYTEQTEQHHIQEIIFLESQINGLLQAIRATKSVDSITALRITAMETVERMQERKRQEEYSLPRMVLRKNPRVTPRA